MGGRCQILAVRIRGKDWVDYGEFKDEYHRLIIL